MVDEVVTGDGELDGRVVAAVGVGSRAERIHLGRSTRLWSKSAVRRSRNVRHTPACRRRRYPPPRSTIATTTAADSGFDTGAIVEMSFRWYADLEIDGAVSAAERVTGPR